MSESSSITTAQQEWTLTSEEVIPHIDELRDIGKLFYERNWSVGTSSNYSVVLSRDPLRILITASGKDKRNLTRGDFVIVDETGKSIHPNDPKPSAETLLHVATADELPEVGAVLHTHSIYGTLLSDLDFEAGKVTISGYEMLKGLEGIKTHEHTQGIEIYDNTQDIATLAAEIRSRFQTAENPLEYGFLMRNHGLYTWGRTLAEARRHIEILEFLFEVVLRKRSLS